MTDLERIPYERFPDDLKALLEPRFVRLGYIGEFFQLGAHQPAALGHFIGLTETLKETLPAVLTELVALTIATWAGNAYERVQHERLCLKLGFTEAWITTVEALAPETADLAPVERAAQRLVLAAVTSQGRAAQDEAAAFLTLTDPQTLVGVMFTIARYLSHAVFCNTLGVAQPFASPLAKP